MSFSSPIQSSPPLSPIHSSPPLSQTTELTNPISQTGEIYRASGTAWRRTARRIIPTPTSPGTPVSTTLSAFQLAATPPRSPIPSLSGSRKVSPDEEKKEESPDVRPFKAGLEGQIEALRNRPLSERIDGLVALIVAQREIDNEGAVARSLAGELEEVKSDDDEKRPSPRSILDLLRKS